MEQLRTFQAVVEQGGFRAAAESLYKSQSAISIAIRKLEHELKVTQFKRDKYRPELTSQGQALYQKSLSVTKQTDELLIAAQCFSLGKR